MSRGMPNIMLYIQFLNMNDGVKRLVSKGSRLCTITGFGWADIKENNENVYYCPAKWWRLAYLYYVGKKKAYN